MMKMGEDVNITSFMQRVNDLVLNIICTSEVLEEYEIVAKVLRSLPPSYKHKVDAIEEIRTMIDVTRDILIRKLVSFEVSKFGEVPPKYEFSFKAIVSGKQKYDPREISTMISRYEEMKECPERDRNPKKPFKPYKSKYQRKCYFSTDEGVIDGESEKGNSGDEWVFIAIKEEDMVTVDSTSYIVEENDLVVKVEEKMNGLLTIASLIT
ncbi:hypothetical protein SUGI_0414300 [Cryptomeria japonica]|nr:hypothetical protein SUGI_0414300 [Cryptomeria japonica]